MSPVKSSLGLVLWMISIYFYAATLASTASVADSGSSSGASHAAYVGELTGQFSSGVAYDEVNKLDGHFGIADDGREEDEAIIDSLGNLGENLSDHDFPADFDRVAAENGAGVEYKEAAVADASEHFQHYAPEFETHDDVPIKKSDHHFGHEFDGSHHDLVGHSDLGDHPDLGSHHDLDDADHDDFQSKPVPGIDHGKGAFSYSTTYEFKDNPPQHEQ